MPDPAIRAFFNVRKDKWLKAKIKPSMQESEKLEKQLECDQKFDLECWLPDAASKASSRAITTHPSKFSHPSTGIGTKNKQNNTYVTPIICEAKRKPDGYVRSGNSTVEKDTIGNAAALDVEEFLNLKMRDGETLLKHIKDDSTIAIELLSIQPESYEVLKDGFLSMVSCRDETITSSKIKQVYFPDDEGYHQLSILSNSGLIFELRRRIDQLRFSEKNKMLRSLKRNNDYSEQGFSEIYNITTIGYGGSNPQNISVLNTENRGKARLLLSAPPILEKRDIRFPIHDFFAESIRFYDVRESLKKLHLIFTTDPDGDIPRRNLESGRDNHILAIFDAIIVRMANLRDVAPLQHRKDTSHLQLHQKIWLCPGFEVQRAQQEEWLDRLCKEITHWINNGYQKTIKKAVTLGPAELAHIQQLISTHREVLR